MALMTVVKQKIDIVKNGMVKKDHFSAEIRGIVCYKVWVLWGLPKSSLKRCFEGGWLWSGLDC